MDMARTLDRGLDVFGTAVAEVGPDQWANRTPCEDWDARELLGHVVGVMHLAERMLRGDELGSGVGVEALDDPASDWSRAAAAVRELLASADLTVEHDTVLGRQPVSSTLQFPACDLYMHGWDLGRAVGRGVRIPDDVVEWLFGFFRELPQEQMRSPRVFGPEQAAPEDADPTTRLMAFAGRSVRDWPVQS